MCAILGGIIGGIGVNLNIILFRRITMVNDFILTALKFRESKDLWRIFMIMGFLTVPYLVIEIGSGSITIGSFSVRFFDEPSIIYLHLNSMGWILAGLLFGIGNGMIGVNYHGHMMIPKGLKSA